MSKPSVYQDHLSYFSSQSWLDEPTTMTHDSALNGAPPNRYSGLTLNTYKHEKTAYRQRDKAEELNKNVEQARDDEDHDEGQSETGSRGVLAGCCLAALLTVLVVVLCRYLSRQNAKEITDKKSLEESLRE